MRGLGCCNESDEFLVAFDGKADAGEMAGHKTPVMLGIFGPLYTDSEGVQRARGGVAMGMKVRARTTSVFERPKIVYPASQVSDW